MRRMMFAGHVMPAQQLTCPQSFVFYHSGVYFEPTCGNTDADLDHEVLAIGFGTDPVGGDYWIVKVRRSEALLPCSPAAELVVAVLGRRGLRAHVAPQQQLRCVHAQAVRRVMPCRCGHGR